MNVIESNEQFSYLTSEQRRALSQDWTMQPCPAFLCVVLR